MRFEILYYVRPITPLNHYLMSEGIKFTDAFMGECSAYMTTDQLLPAVDERVSELAPPRASTSLSCRKHWTDDFSNSVIVGALWTYQRQICIISLSECVEARLMRQILVEVSLVRYTPQHEAHSSSYLSR